MSESSVYFDSDDDSKKEDCALVDAVSELNFENGSLIEVGQSNNDLASAQLTSSEDPESSNTSLNNYVEDEYDYMHDSEWINQRCQVFILSTAGKPIYSLHGSEEKLSTLFGLLQALVSVVSASNDAIRSITAGSAKFVFLVKNPIIIVGVYKSKRSEHQIHNQLLDVYNQVISIVTLSHMSSVYEKRNNYDLRKLLAGSERLVDAFLSNETNKKVSNNPFVALTHSVLILPMEANIRDSITSTIISNCSKIKDLVFAVLLAKNKLITLVRMKNCYMHTDDLRIIFNLVQCTESFRTAESWTPICLPKFNPNGFLHAYISYLDDSCEACIFLMSANIQSFEELSNAKKNITEKMMKTNSFDAINNGMNCEGISLKNIGIPEIRHFLYKNKKNTQLLCSEIKSPYDTIDQFERLENLYYDLHNRIHRASRPLKLIFTLEKYEIQLAWVTTNYELFVTFEPLVEKKAMLIAQVNKLLKWIKKEEGRLFLTGTHVF